MKRTKEKFLGQEDKGSLAVYNRGWRPKAL
jgi:hypothetical protein